MKTGTLYYKWQRYADMYIPYHIKLARDFVARAKIRDLAHDINGLVIDLHSAEEQLEIAEQMISGEYFKHTMSDYPD